MKECVKCNTIKSLEEFTKDKKCADGTTNVCKVCTNLRRKKHRDKNPEQVKKMYEQNKIWKEANRDKILQQVKDNFANRPKELKAESSKKYRQTIKGKIAKSVHNRNRHNAINTTSDGSITSATLAALLEDQGFKCKYCGCTLNKEIPYSVHLDHIIPISKMGNHALDNVVWSCATCNLKKGSNYINK